jgi:hypothetical protein
MAITPSYKAEGTEEHYIEKGAVMMPQTNPASDAKYAAGKAVAAATDKVEWPTKVAGLTN